MTYTYDDIVTAKDILTDKVKKEDIIGKWGWFLEYIPQDMHLDEIQRLGISGCLEDLELDSSTPFGNGKQPFTYFLPGKGDPYEKRQADWIKENNIKVGDKVRILRKFDDFESGCAIAMDEDGEMDPLVGTVGKISAIEDDSIEVDSKGDCWFWPYFVLEKVEDELEDAKPQFKVGDKVRIVKEWEGFAEGCEPTVGGTGRINHVDNNRIRVVLDSDNDWWWYNSDAVELIKDEIYLPVQFLKEKAEAHQAVEQPRIVSSHAPGAGKSEAYPGKLSAMTIGSEAIDGLTALGYDVSSTSNTGSLGFGVYDPETGLWRVGADPTRDAYSVGW